MDENDELELAERRAYDQHKEFHQRFLIELGAPKDSPLKTLRGMIWAGMISIRIQGWFVWVVAFAIIASIVGLVGSLTLRDVLTGVR